MADKKQFSNTKSIVKVETGIVTLILYHHYLKIVGNNKLWPHMQNESWNIHGTKILNLLHYVEWDRFVALVGSISGHRVTLLYLIKQLILKKGGRTYRTWRKHCSTWRIKIKYIRIELYHVNTNIFVIFFFYDRDVWFAQVDQTPPSPFLEVVEHNL